MEVEGSTTFSMGGNCCYVGRERPWRVLESSTRIQSFKSISVVWVDEMVGAGGYKFIEILCIVFYICPTWRIFGPDHSRIFQGQISPGETILMMTFGNTTT